MEIKGRNSENQIHTDNIAKDSVAFLRKLTLILLICFVKCELNWDRIEELAEKITKYKSDLNEIRPVFFRLKRNLTKIKEKIKQEIKEFEYFMLTNKERAKIKKESLKKLRDIEDKIVSYLKKVLYSTKNIKRKIETLCNAECKVTTFYYSNGFIIKKEHSVLLAFKDLNKEMFDEKIEI
jgi:methylthioribose-1-phosphate isomerase